MKRGRSPLLPDRTLFVVVLQQYLDREVVRIYHNETYHKLNYQADIKSRQIIKWIIIISFIIILEQ
jgi:hypothetical protein